MTFKLDRVEIESAGSDPIRLARALLVQLPDLDGRVPIDKIARALDILSIEVRPLAGFEACLLSDPLKSRGLIAVNARNSLQRQRYSIGHELGHFLNERHRSINPEGFACTRQDMVAPRGAERHIRQEIEANSFAIEVLAPRRLLGPQLKPGVDLEHALAIADRFDISREAAARRYVALHEERLAAVFSRNGCIRYIEKSEGFPATTWWTNDKVGPHPPRPRNGSSLTGLDKVAAADWLTDHDRYQLFAQTFYQRDDYAITLLLAERDDGGNDEAWDPPHFRR